MAKPDDHILVLHTDDGEDWAKFLSKRLSEPRYGITCVLKDLVAERNVPPLPPPRIGRKPLRSSKSSITEDETLIGRKSEIKDDGMYTNSVFDDNNNQNSRAQNNKDNSNPKTPSERLELEEGICKSKATVIILSPDIIQGDVPFSAPVTSFSPKTSVFLLLGVEIEEARSFFGKDSEHVFKCRISVIDGTEKTICDALIEIIVAYECNDDEIEDGVREGIYQIAPSPVQANNLEKVFPKKLSVDDREVYILLAREAEELPIVVLEDMSMEVPLTHNCDRLYSFTVPKHLRGDVSFHVESHSHLVGESLVTVNTPLDQIRAILKQEVTPLAVLATALGLQSDDVGGVDTALAFRLQELASSTTFSRMFPCEEALGQNAYDERSNLMWPSLLHFAADLNLRTLCSELLRYPGMLGAALTENRQGLYPCQMAAKQGFRQLEQNLIRFVEAQKTECYDSDSSDYMMPSAPLVQRISPTTNSTRSEQEDSQIYIEMEAVSTRQPLLGKSSGRDSPTSRKALKMLGIREDDIVRSRAASLQPFSGTELDLKAFSVNSNQKSSVIRDKFKYFFSKIKGGNSKRSNSDGDFTITGTLKKNSNSQLSMGSSKSDSKSVSSKKSKTLSEEECQERDSGSYSDEEKNKPTLIVRKTKQKVFKESDKPMDRCVSRRAQHAKKEKIDDAPTLPRHSRHRGTFRSFIDSDDDTI